MPAPNDSTLSSAPSGDRTTIHCLYCHKPQEVSARAQSITCKFCYKRLNLKDEAVNKYEAKQRFETTGIVTVEKRGHIVVVDRIVCGGMIVRGKVKGTIKSSGPVLVGPEAEIKGDVTAPRLAVGAGAVLEGRYAIGVGNPGANEEADEVQHTPAEPD
jgi:hypothetical protein